MRSAAPTPRTSLRLRRWTGLAFLAVAVAALGCERASSPSPPSPPIGGPTTNPAESGSESGSAATAPAPALPISEPRPQVFEVAWAVWGDKERTSVLDATEHVRAALLDDGALVWDDNAFNQAVGDPNPGRPGWLTIGLQSPTRTIIIGLTDSSSISLTVPPEALAPWGSDRRWPADELARARRLLAPDAAESGLIWARWGNDGQGGGWVSASDAIDQQLASGDTIANRTAGMPVDRRPNNFRRKALRLLLALDGQPISLLLRDSSFIATAPTPDRFARTGLPQPASLSPPMPELLSQTIITGTLADAGDIAFTLPSADGEHLYVLERQATRLLKVQAATMQIESELTGLDPIYTCMGFSADGLSLFLAGSPGSANPHAPAAQRAGLLAEVDPDAMVLRRPPLVIRCEPMLGLSALDADNLVTFGRSGTIVKIDAPSGVVLAEIDTPASRGTARVHPDGRRVLVAHSSGIECFTFDPSRGDVHLPAHTRHSAGIPAVGPFTLLDRGRYLLTGAGTLARVGQNLDRVVIGDRTLPINAGAAVSAELGVLAVATQGGLRLLSWPSLQPLAEHPCVGILTDLSIHDHGRTIVARHLADATVNNHGEVSAPSPASLVSIDLASLIPAGFAPESPAPTSEQGQAPIVRRLPLRADLTALVMPSSARSLYALDASEGVVLRIDPASLDIQATSPPLPLSTTHLAIDPTGRWLIAAGSVTPHFSPGQADRAWIVVLDPVSLAPIGNPIELTTNVRDIEALTDGRALVCGYQQDGGSIHEIDLATGQEAAAIRGFLKQSTFTLSPDATMLMVSDSHLKTFWLASRRGLASATEIPPGHDEAFWSAGPTWINSEGDYALRAEGELLSIQRRELQAHGSIGRVLSAAGDAARFVVSTPRCMLNVVHVPSLNISHSVRLEGPLTDLCLDRRANRLYGVLRLGGTDERGIRVNAVLGDIVAIDLGAIPARR